MSGAAGGAGVTLDLRDNFAGDEVVVFVDGREVARERGVATRPERGRARSLDLAPEGGARRLAVALPGLGLREELALPPARPLRLGASLNDARDALRLWVQEGMVGFG